MKKLALYLVVGVALLGCGDDDDFDSNTNPDPNPNPNTELLTGIYTGTTDEGDVLEGLVDDNNRLWFIYSEDDDVLGFVSSNDPVVLNNGEFTASGKNHSYEARNAFDITITGDYKTSKVLKGTTFDLPSNAITYNVEYDDTLSARKQTLNLVNTKTFTGALYVTGDTDADTTTVKFTTDGNFTGDDGKGCTITGKFTPAASGRYFISTVTFGATPCYAAGETHTGVALLDDDDNELILLARDDMENKGLFFGSGYR